MRTIYFLLGMGIFLCLAACQTQYPVGSFGHDLARLKSLPGLEVLSTGESLLAISGPLQVRVLTSSAQGMQGYSHGWFNHTLIQKTVPEVPAAYIGGESRFWLG
ncbi:MAG: DUF6786 family protein, partial [Bacteroidota bacterium]